MSCKYNAHHKIVATSHKGEIMAIPRKNAKTCNRNFSPHLCKEIRIDETFLKNALRKR